MSAGPEDWWLHGVWCGLGLLIVAPTLVTALKGDFERFLTDHRTMFIGAFGLYFLIGGLLLAVAPANLAEFSLSYYDIDARDALRVDAVNGIGFGIALLAASVSNGRFLAQQAWHLGSMSARIRTHVALFMLLVVSAAASVSVMAVDLGMQEAVLSGWTRGLGQLSLVAVLLAAAHRGRGESALRFAAILLATAQCAAGSLLFNKSMAVLPIAALVGGLAWRFGSRRVLPIGGVAVCLLVALLGSPLSYARNTINDEGGNIVAARMRVLAEGTTATDTDARAAYSTWSRLCYTPPQAAALDFYDQGNGGDDLRLIPWLVVPRFLAPEKPIITQSGTDFNEKVTGHNTSATGLGIFVSAYYNAGWLGTIFISAICGWIIAQTSAVCEALIRSRGLLALPLGLYGLYIAFRIDGHFVGDYLGAFVFVLFPLLAVIPFTRVARV